MDEEIKELEKTNIWTMYNKHADYARIHGLFSDVDKCNNFYNGDQWEGLKLDGVEPVQYNFIKPTVNYKVNVVTKNLRAINYSADNVEGTEYRKTAKKICDLFNQRAARVWEKDQMDEKCKQIIRNAAITGEGVLYISYDEKEKNPTNEVLNMVDIFYGNENEPDIQKQPYILIKQRMTVLEAKELAEKYDVPAEKIKYLQGDDDTQDEAGEKDEVNSMITIITRFYRKNGTIHFDKASKSVEICKDEDMEITRYPALHTLWSYKVGSARGEGEVRTIIPNQIETNKTILRRLITLKNIAYPQKVYNSDLIVNPNEINSTGGIIEAKGLNIDDVRKAYAITQAGTMSPDAANIQGEMISTTRELANANEAATGQIDPEKTSGRAILAVQQASEIPLSDQNTSLNAMLEDMAKVWMEMWKVHNKDGMELENISTDPQTNEDVIKKEKIDGTALDKLKTNVKIDITPKGPFDKYAQELSLENLAQSGQFMNTAWLKDLSTLLDNDSVMPKLKIDELIKRREEQQQQIRKIKEIGDLMQSRIQQLLDTGAVMPKEMQQYMPPGQQNIQPTEVGDM